MKRPEDDWAPGPDFDDRGPHPHDGPKFDDRVPHPHEGPDFDDRGPHPHDGPEFEDHMPLEPGPPFSEEIQDDDTPEFAAIRRIEFLARLHHMAFRTLLKSDGLPPAQAGALKVIVRFPGMSHRELADKLHIQRATATVMLQKMEKAGYIDRRSDPEDQRVSRIYPTAMAKSVDLETQKKYNAYFARCFEGIGPDEFAALIASLQKVGTNLQGILAESPAPPAKE